MAHSDPEDVRDEFELMMDREALDEQRRRKRWRYLMVAAMLWVVVFWVLGYYGIRKWRSRQARQLAASATEFAGQGRLREASLRARSAFEMRPEDPQVLKAMAGMLERLGNPQALGFHEKIVSSPEASAADRQRFVEAAIRFGSASAAKGEASRLEQSGDPGFTAMIKADEMLRSGNVRGGEEALRGIESESAAFAPAQLQLAGLLAATGQESERAEAWKIYRSMSDRQDNMAAEAMAAALAAGAVPPDQIAGWTERLQAHPAANDRTFLLAQTAKLETDPDARARLVGEVMARFAGAPIERKALAMHWLNEQQEFRRSIELVSEKAARTDRSAFVLWLDAQAGLQDWEMVHAALETTAEPLEGALAELFRARAARMTGRTGAATQSYQRAVALALADPRELAVTKFFLETDGQTSIWQNAMREALGDPSTKDAAVRGILMPATQSRDAVRMLEASRMLAEGLPDDEKSQDAVVYYGLVLGQSGLLDKAAKLSAEQPDDFPRKAILALALLKEGRRDEAVRVFEGLKVRSDRITPQEKAIVISVLAANRRFDQAQAMALTLNAADLTEQEVAMMAGFLDGTR